MRCGLCHQHMLPHILRWITHPRTNCGGHCWRCIKEIEET